MLRINGESKIKFGIGTRLLFHFLLEKKYKFGNEIELMLKY
jgi:hypothetical protein